MQLLRIHAPFTENIMQYWIYLDKRIVICDILVGLSIALKVTSFSYTKVLNFFNLG
jgi:hypothetical protein